MSNLLGVGDVFALEQGMRVFTYVPRWTTFNSERVIPLNPNPDVVAERSITVGETFKLRHLHHDTSVLAGEYVVRTAVLCNSAEPAHETRLIRFRDNVILLYEGWFVVASKLLDGRYSPAGSHVWFYQTGPFDAKIKNVPVLRHMELLPNLGTGK